VSVQVNSPFPSSAWPRVWSWLQDFRARVVDDYAPATLEDFVERQTAGPMRTWGVRKDGELCGVVWFEERSPVTGQSQAVFRKDYWGPETAGAGLRAVYAEIFAGGARKITSLVFRDNNAILSTLAALGARREGVLRKHTMRGGKLVDAVMTGLLKEDFERCRS
jgi:RimJ/RimL family protein N-acetyltransferase